MDSRRKRNLLLTLLLLPAACQERQLREPEVPSELPAPALAADASGTGHRHVIVKIDNERQELVLRVLPPVEPGIELQAGQEHVLPFADFLASQTRFNGSGIHPNLLREGQVLGIFRDSRGTISRIVVEEPALED